MTAGASGRLTVVFCLLHPGMLRFFRGPIETLAGRGHRVHVAFSASVKDAGDAILATEIAERVPGLTIGAAPRRAQSDRVRQLAGAVRILLDVTRYADGRYAGAPKLRARMRATARERLGRGSALLVRLLSTPAGAALGRPLLRAAERAIPTAEEIDGWLRGLAPDAVLVSPVVDFGSPQVEYLKSAAALGLPSAVCVASWDNLTNRGLLRLVPERVLVWNETQVEEAVAFHGVPRERVVATGAPKFDEWFGRSPSTSAAGFADRVGLSGPFVLYLCSSPFIAPYEVSFVRDWIVALRASPNPRVSSLPVLVRPHPQNAGQWHDTDLSDLGDVSVWPRAGAQPDAGEARADFFDSLFHSLAVIGINTSGLVEAAIVGRPVLTILDSRFAETQEGTLHYRHLRTFLHEASTLPEHLEQLDGVLTHDESERACRFVSSFVRPRGLDIAAAEVFADEVELLAELVDQAKIGAE